MAILCFLIIEDGVENVSRGILLIALLHSSSGSVIGCVCSCGILLFAFRHPQPCLNLWRISSAEFYPSLCFILLFDEFDCGNLCGILTIRVSVVHNHV